MVEPSIEGTVIIFVPSPEVRVAFRCNRCLKLPWGEGRNSVIGDLLEQGCERISRVFGVQSMQEENTGHAADPNGNVESLAGEVFDDESVGRYALVAQSWIMRENGGYRVQIILISG